MVEHVPRRIGLRAVQVAVVAAGIFFLLLLVSRQAHAATIGEHPGAAVVTSPASAGPVSAGAVSGPAGSLVGTVTGVLGSVTAPVTATAPGGSSSGTASSGAP